jgi:tetratricopeptide (TPR) repeat protein
MNTATDDRPPSLEEVYQALLRSLRRRKGFGILFVQCSPAQATQLIRQVKEDLPQKKIEVLQLTEQIDNLYNLIADRPDCHDLNILFIQGIEKSLEPYIEPGFGGDGDYYNLNTAPRILSHLNQQRERFRDDFSTLCFAFIVPLFALKYFVRRAPDFFDWRSGVYVFATDPELVAQQSQQILRDGDYTAYVQLAPEQRIQKLLEIQELLEEKYQTLNNKADLFLEQGILLAAAQAYGEAIAAFDQALAVKQDDHGALYNKGTALSALGRNEEAIAAYDQALAIKPDDHEALNNRGTALSALGRNEEAIAAYDQALAIKPDKHKALNNKGLTLSNLGQYEDAIAAYDQALAINPDYETAYYNKACGYGLQGNVEQAIESLQRAIELDPENRELAKIDKDFDAIRGSDAFRALVGE